MVLKLGLFDLKPKTKEVVLGGIKLTQLNMDMPEHSKLFSEYTCNLDYHNFGFYSQFPLASFNGYYYAIIDGYFCLFNLINNGKHTHLVGSPVNVDGEVAPIEFSKDILGKVNNGDFSKATIRYVGSNHPYETSNYSKKTHSKVGNEYIYDNFKLGKLKGGEFKNLRKNANKFGNRINFEIVPYNRSFFSDVMDIYDMWLSKGGTKYDKIWDIKFFKQLISNADKLPYYGFLVYDKDKKSYIGYFDAYMVNDNIALGVARKLDMEYLGISDYCQIYLAQFLTSINCQYLNDGDDGNKEGLRSLKSKFHPVFTQKLYIYNFK